MADKKWQHRDVQAPRLRILIDPVYVQIANLSSSSTYNKYVSMVRELVSRGHFVYWMLPDVPYEPNEIEDHPNVGIIRTTYIQDQFVVDGLVTDSFFNMFNRIAGKYHIDVVCTSRTGAASMIKRTLESPRFHDKGGNYTDKHYGLPMVVIEEFPQTPQRSHVGEAYWLNQCQGYLTADATIFISDHNRSEVTQAMGGIYTNSTINKFVDKSIITPSGIEIAELDKIYEPDRWKVESQFRVISVGRIMGVSYREQLAWFDYLYKSGMDAKLIVSLSGKLGGPMKKAMTNLGVVFDENNPQFQLIENNPRKNFLKLLRTCQAGIAPMSHLDCPVGLSEAIYMGVPLIMPVADYQKTFFPDYPFVIKPSDKAALLMHLKYIKDDPQRARDMIEPWRQSIAATFNAPVNIKSMCDDLEAVARKPLPKFKTSGAILGFIEELKGERYTFGDIVEYLRECGTMGISIGDLGIRATWTYGRGTIHHSMRYCGYVDTCEGPDEVFVRKDVYEREQLESAAPVKRKGGIKKRKIA
jgi:glycosyltransferase involved in cell wall biosynthesis